MRPGDVRGVAEERDAPDGEPRRFDVEDRLEEGLRDVDQRGEMRGKKLVALALDGRGDIRTDQRRRDARAVALARCVGAEIFALRPRHPSVTEKISGGAPPRPRP